MCRGAYALAVLLACGTVASAQGVINLGRTIGTREIINQPIDTSHEITPGTFWPVTPKAARLRIIVGALPRLPAIAMTPHSAKDTTIPTSATSTPCQKEMPK